MKTHFQIAIFLSTLFIWIAKAERIDLLGASPDAGFQFISTDTSGSTKSTPLGAIVLYGISQQGFCTVAKSGNNVNRLVIYKRFPELSKDVAVDIPQDVVPLVRLGAPTPDLAICETSQGFTLGFVGALPKEKWKMIVVLFKDGKFQNVDLPIQKKGVGGFRIAALNNVFYLLNEKSLWRLESDGRWNSIDLPSADLKSGFASLYENPLASISFIGDYIFAPGAPNAFKKVDGTFDRIPLPQRMDDSHWISMRATKGGIFGFLAKEPPTRASKLTISSVIFVADDKIEASTDSAPVMTWRSAWASKAAPELFFLAGTKDAISVNRFTVASGKLTKELVIDTKIPKNLIETYKILDVANSSEEAKAKTEPRSLNELLFPQAADVSSWLNSINNDGTARSFSKTDTPDYDAVYRLHLLLNQRNKSVESTVLRLNRLPLDSPILFQAIHGTKKKSLFMT